MATDLLIYYNVFCVAETKSFMRRRPRTGDSVDVEGEIPAAESRRLTRARGTTGRGSLTVTTEIVAAPTLVTVLRTNHSMSAFIAAVTIWAVAAKASISAARERHSHR